MPNNERTARIARCATLYRQGIFCPAEFWLQVTTVLVDCDAAQLLDSLSPDVQKYLREIYRDRPWSLRSESRDDEIRRCVERWCLQVDSEDDAATDAVAS